MLFLIAFDILANNINPNYLIMRKIFALMVVSVLFISCSDEQLDETQTKDEKAITSLSQKERQPLVKTEKMIGFEKHLRDVFRMMEDPNRNEDQIRTDFTQYLKEYLDSYGVSAEGYEGNALLKLAIDTHQAEVRKLSNIK